MEKLKEILDKILESVTYDNTMLLLTDGIIDSIALVELVAEIETQFQAEIPLDELIPENFDTIDRIWNMIQRIKN